MRLILFLLLISTSAMAAPRDVVFSWENPASNTNFPPLTFALYEVGNPNILIADNIVGVTEYATTLPDGVGERRYTATYYYIDPNGIKQESDTAIPVSVYFRPNAPSLVVR